MTQPVPLVHGAPPVNANVVRVLLTAAQKAFDAGDFARAGELFLEVWRTDPQARPVLYNAARAFQLAGKVDKAEELFGELLALPDLDTSLGAKAKSQFALLRAGRAERKGEQAVQAEREKQFGVAAALWAEAVRLQPAKVAWLARQARAHQQAGQLQEAAVAYDEYLELAPDDAPERAEAEAWRRQLGSAQTPDRAPALAQPPAARAAETQPAPVARATPKATPLLTKIQPAGKARAQLHVEPGPPVGAWILFGTGTVAVVGGGIVLWTAKGYDDELQKKYQQLDGEGKIVGIGKEEGAVEAARIDREYVIGWAVAGAGALAAVVGLVLALQTPEPAVVLVPTGDGVRVAWRF